MAHKLQNSSKGITYSLFKDRIQLEDYLLKLSKKDYLTLVKYRTSNHYLPVETGRWNRTDISERKCLLCNKNDTGDDLHYLLTCSFFNDSRLQNVPRFDHNNPNILNFKQLMNTHSRPLLVRLCKFIRIIM